MGTLLSNVPTVEFNHWIFQKCISRKEVSTDVSLFYGFASLSALTILSTIIPFKDETIKVLVVAKTIT